MITFTEPTLRYFNPQTKRDAFAYAQYINAVNHEVTIYAVTGRAGVSPNTKIGFVSIQGNYTDIILFTPEELRQEVLKLGLST